jgi:hypothetical protein
MPKSFKWSLTFRLFNWSSICIFHLSHACYIHRPSHRRWFVYPNNILWRSSTGNKLHVLSAVLADCMLETQLFSELRVVNVSTTSDTNDKYKRFLQSTQIMILRRDSKSLNELCFWTLSIVWCLKNKQNWGIKNYRQTITIHTSTNKSHKDQLLTTEQLTWAHTHINPRSQSNTGGSKWPSHCTLP